MTDSMPADDGATRDSLVLDEDERAELLRLRAEDRARREAAAAAGPETGRRAGGRGGWRPYVAAVLIVLGCLLAPLTVVGVWASNQVTDTDRYVANVTPLASDPSVQAAIADRLTAEIFRYVDVNSLTNQVVDALAQRGLPDLAQERLRGLAGAIANGVQGFVRDKVGDVVASPQFEQAWVEANRVAHQELVKALSGEGGGAITVQDGTVRVDLAAFLDVVKQSLVQAGFTVVERMPAVHPEFVLFESRDLARAQTAFRLLDRLGTVLPFLVIGLLALGVYVARDHRRALVSAGLGLAASMLILGIALAVGRSIYLNHVPEDVLPTTTAAVLFDTLVRFVRLGLRMVLVLGLVVAAGAFFSGPSATAVRTRSALSRGIASLRERSETAGLRTGPVGRWVYANRTLARALVIAAGAVAFVFWDRPTGKVVLLLAALVVVGLAIVEFLARPPTAAASPGTPASA